MFISTITDRGAKPALIKTMSFTEARLRMIAENVANMETPGYRAKRLDPHYKDSYVVPDKGHVPVTKIIINFPPGFTLPDGSRPPGLTLSDRDKAIEGTSRELPPSDTGEEQHDER